jgi:hypothetical protein
MTLSSCATELSGIPGKPPSAPNASAAGAVRPRRSTIDKSEANMASYAKHGISLMDQAWGSSRIQAASACGVTSAAFDRT